jgi:CDP-glycerol glycerophosphotransferase
MAYDISIIIPVYNVEKYIQECIESIINQTYKNFEVIIVDNGSEDSTLEIATAFQTNYDWIHVYQHPYGLVGGARNFGIKKATGTYIMFVDGDDLLPEFALEKLITAATNNDADIAMGNIVKYLPDKTKDFTDLEEIHKRDFLVNTIQDYSVLLKSQTPCNKLFRRSLIIEKNINFPENLVHEDLYFTTVAFLNAQKIAVIKETVYYYRKFEQESITSHNNEYKYFENRITILNLLDDYILNNNLKHLKSVVDVYKLEKFLSPIEWRLFNVYSEDETQVIFLKMSEHLSNVSNDVIESTDYKKIEYFLIKDGNYEAYKLFKLYGELDYDVIDGRIFLSSTNYKVDLSTYIKKLPFRYRIEEAVINNSEFILKGYAFFEGLTIKFPHLFITSIYIKEKRGSSYFFNLKKVNRSDIADIYNADLNSGFEAHLDLSQIEGLYEKTFQLYINIFYLGVQREELIQISEHLMIALSTQTDWNLIRRLTNVKKNYLEQLMNKEAQLLLKNIDTTNNYISSLSNGHESNIHWLLRQFKKLLRNPFAFAKDLRNWMKARRG